MNKKIQWAITIMLPLLVYLLPTSETGFTPQIKLFFVCTLFPILLAAFELVPMTVYALAFPLFYIFVAKVPAEAALGPFTAHIPYVIIGGMMLALALEETKLLKRISYGILSVTGKSYAGLIFGIMLIGFILSFMITDIATRAIVVVTFVYGLCKSLDIQKGTKLGAGLMVTASFAALNSSLNHYLNQAYFGFGIAKSSLGFNEYALYFFLPNAIYFFATTLIVLSFFKPEQAFEGKEYFRTKLKDLGKFTWQEVFALAVIVGALYASSQDTNKAGWIFVVAGSLFYIPALKIGQAEKLKQVNYPLFLFVAGCMAIGAAGNFTGGGKYLADLFYPILAGSEIYTLGMLWVFGVLVNFVLTPLARTASLSVPVVEVAKSVGLNADVGLWAFLQGLEQVLMPYEYILVLLVFSYGYLNIKDFMKAFGGKMAFSFLTIMTVGLGWWHIIGVF
ncbi:Di-and tricarboxylate transporter [Desulfotomaculum arcticum]|uniref:Di-and tricarboxylate transporter n=1 Tax=Desulfotruncus arcticus DSM 17038 TaxID=1121424 RepID=A0A1I2TES1_9FIRM|nr:SLC13 family permease [Desulfotruncus arcticus]SFG63305.1 Di-and tricarboxylate transporter [Desulfotomaculum arcticum] [Desulfotruncus arcticus DSM 17038]